MRVAKGVLSAWTYLKERRKVTVNVHYGLLVFHVH